MNKPKTTIENELNAARNVLLAAARQTFPTLEKRIKAPDASVYEHPQFDTMVRILKSWYAGIRRRADAGERQNHSEGDIHTRIFNTGELLLYAVKDAKLPDFQSGGAAILAAHAVHYTQEEQEKSKKDANLKHQVEESVAEIELVAEMYAKLLGIEKGYAAAKLKIERSRDEKPSTSPLERDEERARNVFDAAMLTVYPEMEDRIRITDTTVYEHPAYEPVRKTLEAWRKSGEKDQDPNAPDRVRKHHMGNIRLNVHQQLRGLRLVAENYGHTSFQETGGQLILDRIENIAQNIAQSGNLPIGTARAEINNNQEYAVIFEMCAELLGIGNSYRAAKSKATPQASGSITRPGGMRP